MHSRRRAWIGVLALPLSVGLVAGQAKSADMESSRSAERRGSELFGSFPCAESEVHPSTPAGDLLIASNERGDVVKQTPIACSSMGVAEIEDDLIWEVVASRELAGTSFTSGTCRRCLRLQGDDVPPDIPPPAPTTASASYRLSHTLVIHSLGVLFGPAQTWWIDDSFPPPAGHYSSYCKNSSPHYGLLTNASGYEIRLDGKVGDRQYNMWDPYDGVVRAANVNSEGILVRPSRLSFGSFDKCGVEN